MGAAWIGETLVTFFSRSLARSLRAKRGAAGVGVLRPSWLRCRSYGNTLTACFDGCAAVDVQWGLSIGGMNILCFQEKEKSM